MSFARFALVVVSAGLSCCNSTGVGNPPHASVSLELVSDDHVEPETDGAGAVVLPEGVVTHAVLAFGEIRWLACAGTGGDVVIEGPVIVDLVTHRVEPSLPTVDVPSGGFCGIDAILAPVAESSALGGRSILFSGVRADGVAFILFADMRGTLRMRPRVDVDWDFEGAGEVLWALRPRRWVEESALNEADAETLGDAQRVVAIDVERHPALYQAIRARLAGASTLHLDLNDNGVLDPDEYDDSAWIGTGVPSLD